MGQPAALAFTAKTMINFFRRIRKKLADDNKPLKYMRYAIGEIALVVVGILIALQINNWNEERKERLDTAALMKNTQISIVEDIAQLNYQIELLNHLKNRSASALNIIERDEILSSESKMILDSALLSIGRMGVNSSNLSMLEKLSSNNYLSFNHNSLLVEVNQIMDRIEETKNLQGYFQQNIMEKEMIISHNTLRFNADNKPIYDFQKLKDDYTLFDVLLTSVKLQSGITRRYIDIKERYGTLNQHIATILKQIEY